MNLLKPVIPPGQPRPDEFVEQDPQVLDFLGRAKALAAEAAQKGILIRVSTEPVLPLAMGRSQMRCEAWKPRVTPISNVAPEASLPALAEVFP